jgi:ribonuclease BN (tRNA processing enzyme)
MSHLDPAPQHRIGRRNLIRGAAGLGGVVAAAGVSSGTAADAAVAPGVSPVPTKGTHLVLLGTAAGPVPWGTRLGISSAVVVDGAVYLIDFGHGAFDQFFKCGLDAAALRSVFVTHLHSDHIADLYNLLWLRFGGNYPLDAPVHLYGPGSAGALPLSLGTPVINPDNPTPGLADFMAKATEATAYDVNIRMRDEGWPDFRNAYDVHEITVPDVGAGPLGALAPAMQPFTVMADDKVRVTAILVDHPPVFPSFAYRFETPHGSITFSGDTTVCDNVVTLAKGSEVLVHEAIDLQIVQKFQAQLSPAQLQHLSDSHTDVTKVGAIAQRAGVKKLVLSHLAPGTTEWPDSIWHLKAQKGFTGQVVVGRDATRITL